MKNGTIKKHLKMGNHKSSTCCNNKYIVDCLLIIQERLADYGIVESCNQIFFSKSGVPAKKVEKHRSTPF